MIIECEICRAQLGVDSYAGLEHNSDGSHTVNVSAESDVATTAIDELADAIRLTVEYVGNDTLPAIEGWSWYDALKRHRPGLLVGFPEPSGSGSAHA